MKVELIRDGSYQRRLVVTVPASTVDSALDRAYDGIKGQVRMPGFRPGKAPRKVLEHRFGPRIHSDVANDLVQQGYTSGLEEHELEPVSRPRVDAAELAPGADFEFTIQVEVRPEVRLDRWTGLDVVYPTASVSDDEVDAMVQARLRGQERLVEVEGRPVQAGDVVMVELEARIGGEVVATEPGTMVKTEGDEWYPGLESLLVGLSKDESAEGEVAFGETARHEAVAGRTAEVTAKVLSIQANEVPELSDELADELGYEGGADGMREALRGQLQAQRDEAARNQARANLLQALIDANDFDVPGGMVEQQLEVLMQELRLQQAYRGVDPRQVTFSDAQVADLRVRAAFAVKGGLILEWVSSEESIDVSDADIDAKLQELADERGQTVEAIKGYFAKDDGLDELRDRILEEKTLDWLLERANIVEELATPAGAATSAAEAVTGAAEAVADVVSEVVDEVVQAGEKVVEAVAEAVSGGADLSILDGKVADIKKALATGDHDAHLEALRAAEEAGKARKGVLSAIASREG